MSNVLVLTDDIWVENEVKAALTDPGTQIEVISDPEEVVEAINKHEADVAIIDLQVRSMGGMAVVREIRGALQNKAVRPVHTVLLLDRSADTFLARRAGADAYVLKPFSAQDLRDTIAIPAPA